MHAPALSLSISPSEARKHTHVQDALIFFFSSDMHILLFFTTLKKQEHIIYKRIPTYIRICLYKLDNHAKMSSLYNYIYWANPAVKTWPTQSGTFMRMRRMYLRNRNSSSTVVFPLSSSEKEGILALICQTKFTCSH